jgi:hypothetical protein
MNIVVASQGNMLINIENTMAEFEAIVFLLDFFEGLNQKIINYNNDTIIIVRKI